MANCETDGHIFNGLDSCVFCGERKPLTRQGTAVLAHAQQDAPAQGQIALSEFARQEWRIRIEEWIQRHFKQSTRVNWEQFSELLAVLHIAPEQGRAIEAPSGDAAAKDLPRLVVCAVIIRDGMVLLERRAPSGVVGLDNMWDLPGGKVECGEEVEEALIREMAEELSIGIRPTKMIPYLPTSTWVYADGQRRHWILAPYECEIISGEPVCSEKLQWFPLNALPADILQADKRILALAQRPAPEEETRVTLNSDGTKERPAPAVPPSGVHNKALEGEQLSPPAPVGDVAERKGKYAFSPPSGSHDWWQINDMERMYAVVSIQASVPHAEEITRFAWDRLKGEKEAAQ